MKTVKKAIIPAAGFGTRFLPETKAVPKEMMPIVDTPALHYIVKEVVDSGISDILIITSRAKKSIEDYFDRSPELEDLLKKAGKNVELRQVEEISDIANLCYVRQKEMKGSGQAIMLAKSFVGNEPFAVLFGDDLMYAPTPVTKQLVDAYENTGKCILGVQRVPLDQVHKYGVIAPGSSKGRYTEVRGFVEKPKTEEAPSDLVSMGRYVLTPEVFDVLEEIKPLPGKELYITDAIDVIAKTTGVFAYEFEGTRYDTGDKLGYLKAVTEFALRTPDLGEKYLEYLKTVVK